MEIKNKLLYSFIGLLIIGGGYVVSSKVSNAGLMFPRDSLTARATLTGNASTTLFTVPSGSTYTILYVSENSSVGDSTGIIDISCGSVKLLQLKNTTINSPIERFKMIKCTTNIVMESSGFVGTAIHNASIIYVPYDIATTYSPADWYESSSSTAAIAPSATSTVPYGDWLIMNSFILFFLSFVPVGIFYSLLRWKK